jgi:DNA-binding transcriptional LysR family regulator
MELHQLEMFVAVVEEGSVQRAAKRVFRTQPAVSVTVRKLELQIGAPVFDRSNRNLPTLTPTGKLLYEYAKRLLALRDETFTALKELSDVRRGTLRIGANESISFHLLPRFVQAFLQKHSRVRIVFSYQNSEKLLQELKDRKLDLALLAYATDDPEVETRLLMRDELVLITSPQHVLAGRASVHIKELKDEQVIAEDHAGWREMVVNSFAQHATPLDIRIESATIEMIKKMVAAGLGVGFVPLLCVRSEVERGELRVVPVEGLKQERRLWVARRRRGAHSHAAKAFLSVIMLVAREEYFREGESAKEKELETAGCAESSLIGTEETAVLKRSPPEAGSLKVGKTVAATRKVNSSTGAPKKRGKDVTYRREKSR